ncbi:MAG: glycerophosphodiester phosphodiesterase [Dorea sp.]|nr:glycerophosphodiester phosphodiesterase [Dorea sp.]
MPVLIPAIIVILLCSVLCPVYLFLLAPGPDRRSQMKSYEKQYIAHRGLFNNISGIPENSIPAFQLAVERGYGIELDVQMTSDHKLVVFHDESLKRMCGVNKVLNQCSWEELQQYRLVDTDEKVPLYEEVLKVIGGKVPLIMEVKSEGDWKTTTKMAAQMMDEYVKKYHGEYCMESFHPMAVQWYKKNRPDVIRGQLSSDYFRDGSKKSFFEKFFLTCLLMNAFSRPDFIAYNHKYADQLSYRILRKLFSAEHVCWTIKNQRELEKAKKVFQVFIFDSFIPDSGR